MVDCEDLESVCRYNWHEKASKGKFYVQRTGTNGSRKKIKLHRWLLDAPGEMEVDHRNGNGLDNRRSNLRLASSVQNCMNRGKKPGCSSKFKGVSFDKKGAGAWVAQITLRGRTLSLGRYRLEEDAAIAYDVAAQLFYGDFAWLNRPAQCDHDIHLPPTK